MTDPRVEPSTPDLRRQVCRLGGEYVLRRGRAIASAIDRNFVTALLFVDIVRFNTAGIMSARSEALQHLTFEQPIPDSLRKPVSVYALARNLGMPYETARRHVGKLKAAGLCISVEEGLIVPSAVVSSPEAEALARDNMELVHELVDEAARFGAVAHGRHQPTADDVTRQVGRLSGDYFVEAVQLMAKRLGIDPLEAMVFLTITQNNTGAIRRDADLGGAYGALATVPPDDLRQPVSVYFVSQFLKMPYETTRRATQRLTEAGLVTRAASAALVVPATVLANPDMIDNYAAFADLTLAFLGGLAEYGVAPGVPAVSDGPGAPA